MLTYFFDIRLFLFSIKEVTLFPLQHNLSHDKCQQKAHVAFSECSGEEEEKEKRAERGGLFSSSSLFISILDDKQQWDLDGKGIRRQNG